MRHTKPSAILVALLASLLLGGDCQNESDSRENGDVERQQSVYVRNQPVPFFEWSLERHLMIQLYQARNRSVTTYSYVVSHYTGHILMSCTSLGFPIPATTQLTNPSRIAFHSNSGAGVLPQAEPNGLYSPPMTNATWVMCLGPDGNVEPTYVEDNVMAFTRPMREQDGGLVPVEGQRSTISINPNRPPAHPAH